MEIKKQILLIVNPISGDRDKEDMIREVTEKCNAQGFQVTVHKTDGKKDEKKIAEKISEVKPSRLLVAGGDGTLKLIAEVLEDADLPIGILPAGSANGLATNLGIKGNLEEILKIALSDHFIIMDTLMLNDTLSLHIADLGLNAALIENYENSNFRGKLGYMINAIPTLTQTDYPFNFTIEANGNKVTETGILLAIANANTFGTGANINPTGRVNDGKFEVLVFKKLDLIEIAKTLYGEVEMDPEFVSMICTTEAKITCDRKIAFQIDGEYMGKCDHVTARVHHKKLKIAVPNSDNNKL